MNKRARLFWKSREQLRLTWALLQDERIPPWQKAIPFLPLIYILTPFNLASFALPVVGQIDDVFLLMMASRLFQEVVDKDILAEYKDIK